ncbi:divergent polysaccharide deacetylase family protein [Campylobacter mucosalis]|uniref:divergent polysaccharide deacetylase family protein n=1 Tax=Campylobacter mucosalis TaxID=202 RepID=UPI0014707C7A|nr:divergent polysaccharide deacetylase family protein [Campylobacter mucosalis]
MTTKKNTKKRTTKSKKSGGRFKIYAVLVLFGLLIAELIYISLKNTPKQEQTSEAKIQKTEQIHVLNTKDIIKKEQKNIRQSVKFDKDENLSKIFLDPKSLDETHSLSQKPKLENNSTKQIIKKEQNTTIAKEIKAETNASKIKDKIIKKTELDVVFNDTIQIQKEQNLTKKQEIKEIKKPKDEPVYKKIDKKPEPVKQNFKKGKLAIIIDDIGTFSQANFTRSAGVLFTPSIFPPSKDHPDTPKIAKTFKAYMIHLPMQAQNFHSPEADTLKVGDSYETILKKIQKIKQDFPNVKFINNHTGSKFTSSFDAMDRVFKVFEKENLIFIDSKTAPTTKVNEVAKKYGKKYVSRDVFLDDADNKKMIRVELEKAVKIAQKNGLAIAIGHPRKNTIEVLKNSKDLLQQVELVYLKDIYELYR